MFFITEEERKNISEDSLNTKSFYIQRNINLFSLEELKLERKKSENEERER